LTNKEKLKARVILAQSIDRSPDSIEVYEAGDRTMYLLNDFKGMNFAFCFEEVPTIESAREEIKDYYLAGCEVDFDIEFTDKYKPPK